MTDSVAFEFTGTVIRTKKLSDKSYLTVAVDCGGKYPNKIEVFVGAPVDYDEGDIVTVAAEKMPYAQTYEWKGETKAQVKVEALAVTKAGGATRKPPSGGEVIT